MHPLLPMAFALRLGTMAGGAEAPSPAPIAGPPPQLTTRAVLRPSLLEETRELRRSVGDVSLVPPSGPPVGPVFHHYRPHEWVERVARGLNIADLRITHAALWVASFPVQLDARPGYVFVRVTVRTP
jgi:hypothetical protein